MRTRTLTLTIGALSLALVLGACGGQEPIEDDPASVQESLELDDTGGYTMTDDVPAFGMPDLDTLDVDPSQIEIPELPEEMQTIAGQVPHPKSFIPPCPHGLLKGVWKQLKPGVGVFHGKWVTANGKVKGHLKGIYGQNLKGQRVLFGKYIDVTGTFKGLIKGRYGKGFFKGRYHGVHGAKGVLMGAYGPAKCVKASSGAKKCLPGKGKFVGKWRSFCPKCKILCKPGFKPAPNGKCFCIPAKVVPCIKGKCPKGMYCDPCPVLKCKPWMNCIAVCGPPVCKKLPPKKQPLPPSGKPGSKSSDEAPANNGSDAPASSLE